MSSAQEKRQRSAIPNLPVICVGDGCQADLRRASYARIKEPKDSSTSGDCRHVLCLSCFGLIHANRSANLKLECPGSECSLRSSKWFVCMFDQATKSHNEPLLQRVRSPVGDQAKKDHPTQFYKKPIDSVPQQNSALVPQHPQQR